MRPPLLLAIAVTLVTWASAFVAIRHAVRGFPPGSLALIRFSIASAVLAFYVFGIRREAPPRLNRRDLAGFALIGLIGIAVYHVALNAGERTVSAGAASLLINTGPIWTALIAIAFLGERLGWRGWIGTSVAFAGAVLVSLGSAGGVRFDGDVALVVLASVAQAVYFVVQKPYLKRFGALDATCYSIWIGTLLLLPLAPEAIRALSTASRAEVASAVYLGVIPGAVGNFTWIYTLAHMPASRAASLLYLVPFFVFVIAWSLLGESPGWLSIAGGVPILIGVSLVNSERFVPPSRT